MSDPAVPDDLSASIKPFLFHGGCPKCGKLHPTESACWPSTSYTFQQTVDCTPLLWAELAKLNDVMSRLLVLLEMWQGDGK